MYSLCNALYLILQDIQDQDSDVTLAVTLRPHAPTTPHMAVPHHASHIVLRSYYAHICPLREYLSLTTLENDLSFIDEDARLAELVASVTVASNVPWNQCPKHRLEAPEISMAQVPASHTT